VVEGVDRVEVVGDVVVVFVVEAKVEEVLGDRVELELLVVFDEVVVARRFDEEVLRGDFLRGGGVSTSFIQNY